MEILESMESEELSGEQRLHSARGSRRIPIVFGFFLDLCALDSEGSEGKVRIN